MAWCTHTFRTSRTAHRTVLFSVILRVTGAPGNQELLSSTTGELYLVAIGLESIGLTLARLFGAGNRGPVGAQAPAKESESRVPPGCELPSDRA